MVSLRDTDITPMSSAVPSAMTGACASSSDAVAAVVSRRRIEP
jgi:hypothetical protein